MNGRATNGYPTTNGYPAESGYPAALPFIETRHRM